MYKIRNKKVVCIIFLCCLLCGCNTKKIVEQNREQTATPQISETKTPVQTESVATDNPKTKEGSENSAKDMNEKLHFYDEQTKKWYDTKINPNIEKHQYDWSCLSNVKNEISYTGEHEIKMGVDVSHHQGTIDWQKVKADGYDFAIIRIAYRGYGKTGSLNVDKEFKTNIKNAHEAGIDVGVYIFSQAINENEAIEEANLVIEQLKDEEIELPVVFDPELIRTDEARTDNISGEQFTKNTIAFCEKIKDAGYEPMIYSNMYWEAFLFEMEKLSDYPIWYADYETIPQTPYEFEFWQYADDGVVDGISGKTDLNVWFYTKEE